jgi:galactonate dehydratase
LTRWGFREVCELHAVAYLQPDPSHVGGISELKKVANLAEIYYMHIMPHCAIGPVALAAAMQVDAVVPNFLIQEQVDASLGDGLLQEPWQVRDGYIELPTRPGIGVEIDEREAEQHRTYQEELGGEFYYPEDRSIADW